LTNKYVFSFEPRRNVNPGAHLLTLYKNLWDFGVAGAESTVDFKAVCVVQKRASQGEEDFLGNKKSFWFL